MDEAARGAICPQQQAHQPPVAAAGYIIGGIAVILFLFGGVGVWAAHTKIAGAVIAPATVVVDSNVKKIQHPSGGIVNAIHVRNGDRVHAGETLIMLDDTQTRANLQIITNQIDEVAARLARLAAEQANERVITFPPDLLTRAKAPSIRQTLDSETALFTSRKLSLTSQERQLRERILQLENEIHGLDAQRVAKSTEIDLIGRELTSLSELERQRLVPASKMLALRREAARLKGEHGQIEAGIAQAKGRIAEVETAILQRTQDFQKEVATEIREAQARLAEALRSDKVVAVVTEKDREQAFRLSGNAVNTWHYRATNIRDFAWASSNRYLWDATRALVGPSEKQKVVAIHNFYRAIPEASAWVHGARYNRMATEFLSRFLWPYSYPQMTSVEGILDGGGMEYPMITVIQSYKDTLRLAGNLMHEIGHMWFPMNVGSDENRYPWQDEGLTQFNSAVGVRELFGHDRGVSGRETYLYTARRGREVELMRHGNFFPAQDVYYALPYNKTSNILFALRAVLGEEVFMRAYREYGQRWRNKHPQPHDFFNTFNEVAGRDLSWFWRTWFYETWTLDQAIASVQTVGDSVEILVEDRGLAPMPVQLMITREGGQTESREIPVETWLAGAQRHTVRVSKTPALTRIEIDAENNFPDIDRTNQVWQK